MTGTDADENEAVLPGQLDNDELITEISKNLSEGRCHIAEWRMSAREDYDFFAGIQWNEEDAAKLREENRPVVTFNRVARTINAVCGLEVQNRQEVRYFPRQQQPSEDTQQDPNKPPAAPQPSIPKMAELLTHAGKWVRDQCDAEDEESEAFQDALICGMGCTETRIDYEENPEGKTIIERVDPFDLVVDPSAKKRNFIDARWIARVKEVTKKQFREMWPDYEDEVTPGVFWNDYDSSVHEADEAWKYESDEGERLSKANTVSVVQYQYYERTTMYKVLTPDGNMVEVPEDRFEKMQPVIESQKLKYVKFPKRTYYQCFLMGKVLLDKIEIGCSHFTFQPITGLRDRNRNYWFGLVSLMKDPQRWANKWLSQIQHIINTNAKGGAFVEVGALRNPRKAEDDWAKPDALIMVNDGALSQSKIMPREMPRYPEGVDRLLQYAVQSINDVPGVNLELIGLADRDQPNVLEQTRKQAGITILATFFDSLRRYRKVQGRVLAYYIREYMSDGRLIRVVGQEGAQYVPLLKDAMAFEYDIIVDDAPTSPNVKERTFGALSQFLPMAMSSGIPIPPEILDYAPLPEDLIQKWKKLIISNQNDPMKNQLDQIKNMLMQLEVQQKQADVQKTQSDVTLNYAKSEQAHAIGQDEAAQAQQKLGIATAEHQMKYEMMMKEQARKDLEMQLNMRRKELEAQLNAQLKANQPFGGMQW
jgi:hypothetical protein